MVEGELRVSLDRIRRVASPLAQEAYGITLHEGEAPSTDDERCELAQGNGVRLPGSDIPWEDASSARATNAGSPSRSLSRSS